jgi:hypothetical protein
MMHRIRSIAFAMYSAICAGSASAAHLPQDLPPQLPPPGITDNAIDSAVAGSVSTLKGLRHIQSADNSMQVFADTQRSRSVMVMGNAGGN